MVEQITPSSIKPIAVTQELDAEIFEKMEQVQTAIDPYLAELNVPQETESIDPKLAEEALDVVNEIRTFYGEEPITNVSVARRLHSLLNKIALVVENHLFHNKVKNYKEETKIKEETVPQIQKWTRWGGNAYFTSALASPLLMFGASMVGNEQMKAALQGVAGVTGNTAQGLSQTIESWKTPEEHKRSMFVQLAATKKQAEEGLKNLPQQMQQALQKLIDLEGQRIRQMGQRG